MSLFKNSPSKQPSANIKFVRNVRAMPKNSEKNIAQNQRKFSTAPNIQLSLTIHLKYEYAQQIYEEKYRFPYSQNTTVSMLITFLKHKLKKDNVYFTSNSLHLDYFLMLHHRLVSEINVTNLYLVAREVKLGDWKNRNSQNSYFQVQNQQISLKSLEIIKCIGSGGFSRVFLARLYGILLAVKVINKQFIVSTGKQSIIQNQRLILEACQGHPFITKLYAAFETPKYVVFTMQYCSGGELFNLLRKVKRMNEKDAKFYFLETLTAIQFLHSKGILYRDLKPENIMIDSQGHVRLADFGLSKVINDQLTYSFCGSAEYMSPEMLLKKGHGYEVDYYCLGALLYELVTGLPPYYTTDQTQLFDNILNTELTFPSHSSLSHQIKNFLTKMLQKDISKRFKNIKQILKHPWVSKNLKYQKLVNKQLAAPYPTQIFTYNFDDSQFAWEEKKIMDDMEKETYQNLQKSLFPNLYYESKEIINIKKRIIDGSAKKNNFLKTKSSSKIHPPEKSREISIRSRQSSIASRSSNNQHYFPSRRQTFDNIKSKKDSIINSQSTPVLNRFLIKASNINYNEKQKAHSRQNSINSLSNHSKGSQGGNFKNIYTTKAGYYQNKYSSKLNNSSYSRLWNKNSGKEKPNFRSAKNLGTYLYSLSNSSTNIYNLMLDHSLDRSRQLQNRNKYRMPISRSMSKDIYSYGESKTPNNQSNNSSRDQSIGQKSKSKKQGLFIYSKKFMPSQQLTAKKYLDVHKLNMSKLKKSAFQSGDKSNYYQNTTYHTLQQYRR